MLYDIKACVLVKINVRGLFAVTCDETNKNYLHSVIEESEGAVEV